MNADKWQKINELFHAALDVKADERSAFIKEKTDDEEIFAEVQKLINAHEKANSFIQKPVAEDALKALSNENNSTIIHQSNLSEGQKIGRFEIISTIGKGGMGEVFLAHDSSLGRDVAIKTLLPEFTADANRLRRFQLEAKTASALNHPNILTIYEIGESNDLHFIAAEFVKGNTLTEYLSKDNSLKNSLKIALQIVSALQAAHEAGIIHRDIKPDNIMIRQDRIVKVLDFGLAKLLETENQRSKIKNQKSTMQGLIMGTPNYMSPEQARGKEIDFQTDIFSFGIVLYEMLSGKLPFKGDTINDTIAAILTKDPEPLNEIPPELEKLVEKCLQKDKQHRYQTAKSLFDDLTELTEQLQVQDRLEKSFVPNADEAKTQVLRLTTVDEKAETITTNEIEKQPKSLTKYLLAGVAIILISIAGFFGYKYFNSPKQVDSIAVIPFINKTNNSEMEYLSDGMTETLINSLSKIPNLNVKARSSVFRYKGNEKDFKKIAEELKVQGILTGEVIQRGEQLILNLELVDAETENRLWGETYTRTQTDVAKLQNEIARDVFTNLQAKISGIDTTKVLDSGTTNPEAFQLYLKGRYWINNGNFQKTSENIQYFQKAVEIDPNFALGYVGLADAYTLLGTVIRAKLSPQEAMPKAKAAAEKAIQLNPNLSEAYTSLAWIKFRFDWDWTGAEKDFQKAIQLNPTYAQAHHWYSEFLYSQRRYDEAFREMKIAYDLEPFSHEIQWNYGKALFFAKRYDEAQTVLEKSLEKNRADFRYYLFLINIYKSKGMNDKILDLVLGEATVSNFSDERIETYKQVFKQKGIEEFLKKRAEFLAQDSEKDNASSYFLALRYMSLGNKEKTLDLLEKAYAERIGGMVNLYGNTLTFEPLENEPRYLELLRKMKFIQ